MSEQVDQINKKDLESRPPYPIENRPRTPSSLVSVETNTSTIEFGHEPFETYQLRVKELCSMLWNTYPERSRLNRLLGTRVVERLRGTRIVQSWLQAPPKDFLINRLRGGGFNRIIAINVVDSNKVHSIPFILRVPRFDDAKPERELAPLRYVGQHTSIPVAKVHKYDFTSNNPLDSPYVIQHRIAGNDLQHPTSGSDFPNLSFDQKCIIARDVGQVLRALQATSHPSPGRIEAMSKAGGTQSFTIRPFEVKMNPLMDDSEVDEFSHSASVPSYQSTLEFFMSQFARWKDTAMGISDLKVLYMDRLTAATSQMHAAGYLGDNKNSLCHLDLNGAPRNIMADIDNDKVIKITGILDWDGAIFAPQFIGCAPSFWLWTWDSWVNDPEDESMANYLPANSQERKLKHVWEEAVGSDFLRYAYKTEYRLARRLFKWALEGIHSTWEMDAADTFLDDWATIRPEDMPHIERVRTVNSDSLPGGSESLPSDGDPENPGNKSEESVRTGKLDHIRGEQESSVL